MEVDRERMMIAKIKNCEAGEYDRRGTTDTDNVLLEGGQD